MTLAGCMVVASSLTSCGDKEESTAATQPAEAPAADESADTAASPSATPAAPTSEAAPAAQTLEEAQEQLNRLYNNEVKKLINRTAANPTIRDTAILLLENLKACYTAMASQPVSVERVSLAVDIASFQREMGAWERSFESYELALKEWESLPMKQKAKTNVQQLKSSIYNGLGAVLLYLPIPSNDAAQIAKQKADSLKYFKEQLDNDLSIFTALGPKEGDTVPAGEWSPEVNRATSDLISSYRCVADGLRYNEQFDEAREAYLQGVKIAQRVQKLSDEPSMQLIKILSALGDLERSQDKHAEAFNHWRTAATIAAQVNKNSRSYATKLESKQIVERLTPVLRTLQTELAAKQAASEGASPDAATTPAS